MRITINLWQICHSKKSKMRYTINGFLGGVFVFSDIDALRTWIDGAKHALYAFAVNNNGCLNVGSTGTTYAKAVQTLYDQYKEATGKEWEEQP